MHPPSSCTTRIGNVWQRRPGPGPRQPTARSRSAGAGGAAACVPVRVVDPEDFELRRRGPFRSVRQLPGPGSPPPKPRATTVRRP